MKNLIKAREGVYGRVATPEEKERLQAFAQKYIKDTQYTESDLKALRQFSKKMLKAKHVL